MIRSNSKLLEQRLKIRLSRLEPDSRESKDVLHRIGSLLRTEMIMNTIRQNINDTGALRNSINYFISGNVVEVGSFGVPYAKFHEFGANLGPSGMRAMFAAMRARRSISGKRYKDKNVIMGTRLMARPFVRPALQTKLGRIREILAEYGEI
jgi:phage gpG-like protein